MTSNSMIELPGSADITMVATFHETLKKALDDGMPVVLDASSVTRADTAFLQLLTSFIIDTSAREIPLEWASLSESFKQAANLLGLSEQLQITSST